MVFKSTVQYINLEDLSTFQRSLTSSLNTLRRSLVTSLVGNYRTNRRTAQLVHIATPSYFVVKVLVRATVKGTGGKAFNGCFS